MAQEPKTNPDIKESPIATNTVTLFTDYQTFSAYADEHDIAEDGGPGSASRLKVGHLNPPGSSNVGWGYNDSVSDHLGWNTFWSKDFLRSQLGALWYTDYETEGVKFQRDFKSFPPHMSDTFTELAHSPQLGGVDKKMQFVKVTDLFGNPTPFILHDTYQTGLSKFYATGNQWGLWYQMFSTLSDQIEGSPGGFGLYNTINLVGMQFTRLGNDLDEWSHPDDGTFFPGAQWSNRHQYDTSPSSTGGLSLIPHMKQQSKYVLWTTCLTRESEVQNRIIKDYGSSVVKHGSTDIAKQSMYFRERMFQFAVGIHKQTGTYYYDFVTDLETPLEWNEADEIDLSAAFSKVDAGVVNYSIEPTNKKILDSVEEDVAGLFSTHNITGRSGEAALPMLFAYTAWRDQVNQPASEGELWKDTEYKEYVNQMLANTPRTTNVLDKMYNDYWPVLKTSLENNNIKEYYEKYLLGLDSILSSNDPDTLWDLTRHIIQNSNVILMQSMFQTITPYYSNWNQLGEGYDFHLYPLDLYFYCNYPFSSYSHGSPAGASGMAAAAAWMNPLRVRSLVEGLDRWDMDYSVLKAIVENEPHSIQSLGLEQKKKSRYTANAATGRPLFSSNDSVVTYPQISTYKSSPTGNSAYYKKLNSFHFYEAFETLSAAADPTLPTPAGIHGQGTNYTKSFLDWYEGYVRGNWPRYISEDIYGLDCNHRLLYLPGTEDPYDPHVKRESCEEGSEENFNNFVQYGETGTGLSWTTPEKRGGLMEFINFWNPVFYSDHSFGEGQTRTFDNIINGAKAANEIVFFRIEKKDRDNKIVQNFYFPNAPEFNPKYFVDTQLVYNKDYSYSVYAWVAIFGTKYSYSLDGQLPPVQTPGSLTGTTVASTTTPTGPPIQLTPLGAAEINDHLWKYIHDYDDDPNFSYAHYLEQGYPPFSSTRFVAMKNLDEETADFNDAQESTAGVMGNRWWAERYNLVVAVNSYPHIKFVEVPYDSLGHKIVYTPPATGGDDPDPVENENVVSVISTHPAPPNVEIAPFENDNKTLLFLLSSVHGTQRTDFMIGINPEDDSHILQAIQNKAGTKGWPEYDFETLMPPDKFESYRIEERPVSYRDFHKSVIDNTKKDLKPLRIRNFNQETGKTEIGFLRSTSYKDNTIEPNKKYYYTFRVVDMYGKFSNPTPVYQVEIVDDGGTIYPIIDIVDFDPDTHLQSVKNIRKYINIVPTYEQSEMDLTSTVIFTDFYGDPLEMPAAPDYENMTAAGYMQYNHIESIPKFGNTNLKYKIFQDLGISQGEDKEGQKQYFKIRLTSKKTGKKIDVNFRFRNFHNATKEEESSIINQGINTGLDQFLDALASGDIPDNPFG